MLCIAFVHSPAFHRYPYRLFDVSPCHPRQPPPETGYYNLHLSVNPSSWKVGDPSSNAAARAAAERLAALSTGLSGAGGAANPAFPLSAPSPIPAIAPNSTGLAPSPLAAPATGIDSLPSPGQYTASTGGLTPAAVMPAALPNVLQQAAAASTSAGGPPMIASFEQWQPFYTYLSSMSSSQKADLIMKLSQADTHYAALATEAANRQRANLEPITLEPLPPKVVPALDLEQAVEGLLTSLELIAMVQSATDQARQTFETVHAKQKDLFGGTQIGSSVVTIGGHPFLLRIPSGLSVPHEQRKEAYVAMAKYQTIRGSLSAMLNAARTSAAYSSSSSSRARLAAAGLDGAFPGEAARPTGAGLAPRVNGFGAIGIGQQAAARLAGPGMPTARLAVVINVEELLSLLVPLTFLAVKLGFLIYIFARHASPRKRYIMIAMAVVWVFWEGRAIRRRRRQQEARRNQAQPVRPGQAHRAAAPAPARAQQPIQPRPAAGQPVPAPAQNMAEQYRAAVLNDAYDERGHNPHGQAAQGQPVVPGSPEEQALIATGLQERLERYQRERDRARDRRGRGDAVAEGGAAQANPRPAERSRSHRQERPAPNRLSPKHWLSVVAKVGLSAEAKEMGITRAAVAANNTAFTAIQNGSASQEGDDGQRATVSYRLDYRPPRLTVQRIMRNIFVCVVLFVGTLIPDVERMRKKYLERRQRRITDLENARTAAALAVQRLHQQQTLSPEQARAHEQSEVTNIGTLRRGSRPPSPGATDRAALAPESRLRQGYLPEGDDTAVLNATGLSSAVGAHAGENQGQTASSVPLEHRAAEEAQMPASAAMLVTSSGDSSSTHSQVDGQDGRSAARAAAAAAAQRRQQALTHAADSESAPPDTSGELFDPPFSEAEYAAALGQTGANGEASTSAEAATSINTAPQRALIRDERMHLGVMEDPSLPTTPLRSPADPELEDDDALLDGDGEGDADNEVEGVDDEVGM